MKKVIKQICVVLFLCFSVAVFTGCDLFGSDEKDKKDPVTTPPTAVRASGYATQITVGDPFSLNLIRVEQQINDEWKEIARAKYRIICDYDGTKYGDFTLSITLPDYPEVSFSDTITAKPLEVEIPTFSTVYTGNAVNIKTEIEKSSNDLYSVVRYTNQTNAGEYNVLVALNNPDKYVWMDEGVNKGSNAITLDWSIEKAPAVNYSGDTTLTVNYGATLAEIANDNNLQNIIWLESESTKVTKDGVLVAHYNPDPQNYNSSLVSFDVKIVNN